MPCGCGGYRFGPRLTSTVTGVSTGLRVPGFGLTEMTRPFLTRPEYLRRSAASLQCAPITSRRATASFRRATVGTRQTTGCGASTPFSRTVTDLDTRFATTRSLLPSESRSSIAIPAGALADLDPRLRPEPAVLEAGDDRDVVRPAIGRDEVGRRVVVDEGRADRHGRPADSDDGAGRKLPVAGVEQDVDRVRAERDCEVDVAVAVEIVAGDRERLPGAEQGDRRAEGSVPVPEERGDLAPPTAMSGSIVAVQVGGVQSRRDAARGVVLTRAERPFAEAREDGDHRPGRAARDEVGVAVEVEVGRDHGGRGRRRHRSLSDECSVDARVDRDLVSGDDDQIVAAVAVDIGNGH